MVEKTHKKRYLHDFIEKDLKKKMVFLGGPRQVGKTTLALRMLGGHANESHPAYLNWDYSPDRSRIQRLELPEAPLLILDELHKYVRWRGWLKGLYDKTRSRRSYLITGSARLDHYRRGGAALQGRYHSYRLHPYSLGELDPHFTRDTLLRLLERGGFPEPYFAETHLEAERWKKQYNDQVVKDDLRDLETIREISLVQLLLDELPECVGSPLSIKKFSDKLEVGHATVKRWIDILERLYLVFRIAPFGARKIRAVKKEQKLYFWNWAQIEEPGPRFENLVASQLLKHCHYQQDVLGKKTELRYVRDCDKREVDFIVLENERPTFAVECKLSDKTVSPAIPYFSKRIDCPIFYQVHLGQKEYGNIDGKHELLPFEKFCQKLKMV